MAKIHRRDGRLSLKPNVVLKGGGFPLLIPNLAFWYNPDLDSGVINDQIGTVLDRSGYDQHLSQSNASQKPIYLDATTFRYASFDGTDDTMAYVGSPILDSAEWTVAMYFNAYGNVIDGAFALSKSDQASLNNYCGIIWRHNGGGVNSNIGFKRVTPLAADDIEIYFTDDDCRGSRPRVVVMYSDGNTISCRIDGNEQNYTLAAGSNTGQGWDGINNADRFRINCLQDDSGESLFCGLRMSDMFGYNARITDDEIIACEQYLANKHGIEW